MGTMNNTGKMLINLCVHYNLVIGGNLIIYKPYHEITWITLDNQAISQPKLITSKLVGW